MARPTAIAGCTVWLTGLPGAGKTTIAGTLAAQLDAAGARTVLLDGDELRRGPHRDLGFDAAGRTENVRRTAALAREAAQGGAVAIVSLVSPYATDRAAARLAHERAGLRFVEVHVATSLADCERRDPKGLYARARSGELSRMTGVDDPYEAPTAPELTVLPQASGHEREADRLLALVLGR